MRKSRKKIELGTFNDAPVTIGDVFNNVITSPVKTSETPVSSSAAQTNAEPRNTESFPAKAHFYVSIERKGHAGKTVTFLKGFAGTDEQCTRFVKELKTSLGCGAAFADGVITLQGDQRERLKALLLEHGAAKGSVG